MTRIFSDSEKTKIKQLISEGVHVSGEVEALRGGLNDTIKAVAEELDLKPALIRKAIKVAYKAEAQKQRDEFDELETLLEIVTVNQ
jgi:hypothetical protein